MPMPKPLNLNGVSFNMDDEEPTPGQLILIETLLKENPRLKAPTKMEKTFVSHWIDSILAKPETEPQRPEYGGMQGEPEGYVLGLSEENYA